jgi:predicted dehydrogenase
MDPVVHLADLLRWYFDSEVVEVYAEIDNLFYPEDVEVDTAGLLLLRLENGLQASIDCSWSRPTWYPRWGHLKMEVLGDNGTAVMDSFAQQVNVYSRHAPRPHAWAGFAPDPNQAMVEEFIASIREQRPPSIGFNDGYEAMRVALAAYESARLKAPVELS